MVGRVVGGVVVVIVLVVVRVVIVIIVVIVVIPACLWWLSGVEATACELSGKPALWKMRRFSSAGAWRRLAGSNPEVRERKSLFSTGQIYPDGLDCAAATSARKQAFSIQP